MKEIDKIHDKYLMDLARWIVENLDITAGMPIIFTNGGMQERLEASIGSMLDAGRI